MDGLKPIDLHVHIGPEPIPRKFDAFALAKTEEGRLYAVAMKSHFYPTTPFAEEVNKKFTIRAIGSITLNNYCGGLNGEAVIAASRIASRPMMVWLPTINAKNFLDKSKYELPPEWGVNPKSSRLSRDVRGITIFKNRRISEDALEMLRSVKETGSILATGHLSWEESRAIAVKALGMGIKTIITHPVYQMIDMPVAIQTELAEEGAMIEQAAAMAFIDRVPIRKIVEQIKSIGMRSCIITSDSGQLHRPNPTDVLASFSRQLIDNGISESEISRMLIRNPRRILR